MAEKPQRDTAGQRVPWGAADGRQVLTRKGRELLLLTE